MENNTNGNLAGYFPTTPATQIGTLVVLAALGFIAYKAFKK